MIELVPGLLTFRYCFDGSSFPKLFTPVLCIMRTRDDGGKLQGTYTICTAVHDPETPNDIFWIEHNSIRRDRIYPYAYLITDGPCSLPFLEALQQKKTLHYKLNS